MRFLVHTLIVGVLLSCSGAQEGNGRLASGQIKFGACEGVLRLSPVSAADAPGGDQLLLIDLDADGNQDLVRIQFQAGLVFWQPGLGSGEFAAAVTLMENMQGPAALIAWPATGQHAAFIVIAEEFGGRILRLQLDAQGEVQTQVIVSGLLGPSTLAKADLDGDGILDLSFTTIFDGQLGLLRGTQQGEFEPLAQIPLGSLQPRFLALGDVNADGHVDALIAGADSVLWLANDGQGGFDFASAQPVMTGLLDPQALLLGSDPADLFVVDGRPGRLLQLPWLEPGQWGAPREVAIGLDGVRDLQLADLDQSGRADLLFLEREGGRLQWLAADDQGDWMAPEVLLQISGRPAAAHWEDADGDDDLDLVLSFAGPESGLEVFRQDCLLPPVANIAELALEVDSAAVLALDGRQSFDPDGQAEDLEYRWITSAGSYDDAGLRQPNLQLPQGPIQVELALVVVDIDGLASEAAVALIQVLEPNAPPIADAGSSMSIQAPAEVFLDGSNSTDPDGDDLNYAWTQTSGPAVNLVNANSAVAQFVAPTTGVFPIFLTFTLVVQDPRGLTDAAEVNVEIQAPNVSPMANAGADQLVPAQSLVQLDGSGSLDPDGVTLSYSWAQLSGPSVTLSNSSAAAPEFTAPSNAAVLEFALTVTDASGASATDTVRVEVFVPNQPPTANAGVDQLVPTQSLVQLDGSGSLDPDGVTLSYSWAQLSGPSVTLSSASAAAPEFTAPSSAAVLEFALTVTDASGASASATDTVRVEVFVPNQPPTANAGVDQLVPTQSLVQLDGSGSLDPDGVTLSYSWAQLSGPSVTLSSASAAAPEFTAPSSAAVLEFALTVTDASGASATDIVRVEVFVPNQPPIANAGVDQLVSAQSLVQLDGSGSVDPDGVTLSYSWAQLSGPSVTLSSASAAAPEFTAPSSAAVLEFALTVTDAAGASATDTVRVEVFIPNQPPTANAGVDQLVLAQSLVQLDGSGSVDPDGVMLSYSWTQLTGPPVILSGLMLATPEFTAPLSAAVLEFALTVTDASGSSALDTVRVEVFVPNQPPTANAGVDQMVPAQSLVQLDGSGSTDPDGVTLSYSWAQLSGPSVILSSASAAVPEFTAPSSAAVLEFALTVTDAAGASATDTVRVEVVVPNQPPTANAGPNQTVSPTSVVTLIGSDSSDPEQQPLQYNWVQLSGIEPALLSDPNAESPTFEAPPFDDTLSFELTVTDAGGLQASDVVTITVQSGQVISPIPSPTPVTQPPPNSPPQALAGLDQKRAVNSTVTLDGSESFDPDGDSLSYLWEQTGGTNTVTLSDPTAILPTFTAPATSDTLTFRLVVSDPFGAQSADSVGIEIAVPNNPPIARAGPDQTVAEATTVLLDGSVSNDPDGDTLSYAWQQTGGTPVTLVNPNSVAPSFVAPAGPDLLSFELEVSDGRGGFSTDTMGVEVLSPSAPPGPNPSPGNNPPNAVTDPDQTVEPSVSVTLVGINSSDPDSDPLTYLWEQIGGTPVTLSNATSANATFTAPAFEEDMSFRLTVTDPSGASSTNTTGVMVRDPNTAPVAAVSPDQRVIEGDTVVLDASGSSDFDGDPLQFTWEQIGGTPVTLSDVNAAAPTFTAPAAPADLSFRVQVSDGRGGVGVESTGVVVEAAGL